MDDRDRRIRELEQEVLDERSLRYVADRRSAEQTEKALIWRRRAEERKERIERLKAGVPTPSLWDRLRGTQQQATASPAAVRAERSPVVVPEARRHPPGYPVVRVGAIATDPGIVAALETMDLRDVGAEPAASDGVDLVVIEPAAYLALDEASRRVVTAVSERSTRPPMLVWETDHSGASNAAARTLAAELRATPVALPSTFDPITHNPAVGPGPDAPGIVAGASAIEWPSRDLLERAASGVPLLPDEAAEASPEQRSAASAVARRWAYRHHAPWIRAGQLIDLAGISAPDPSPEVAGILVSNRPELIPEALQAMAGQTYPRFSLVVGLHGVGGAEVVRDVAGSLGMAERVTVMPLPGDISLGEALNRCTAATSAPLLAKIDDDDHYGPAYIEDGAQAFAYSGAGVVGKATQFTYVADEATTVLRRLDQEEVFLNGTPNSIFFRRSVWEQVHFPHRQRHVDSHLVRGARAIGEPIYATSRWEFCYVRRSDGHTWTTSAATFLAGAEPVFAGDHPERISARGWPLDAR
jgi:hypothetical protein